RVVAISTGGSVVLRFTGTRGIGVRVERGHQEFVGRRAARRGARIFTGRALELRAVRVLSDLYLGEPVRRAVRGGDGEGSRFARRAHPRGRLRADARVAAGEDSSPRSRVFGGGVVQAGDGGGFGRGVLPEVFGGEVFGLT